MCSTLDQNICGFYSAKKSLNLGISSRVRRIPIICLTVQSSRAIDKGYGSVMTLYQLLPWLSQQSTSEVFVNSQVTIVAFPKFIAISVKCVYQLL